MTAAKDREWREFAMKLFFKYSIDRSYNSAQGTRVSG